MYTNVVNLLYIVNGWQKTRRKTVNDSGFGKLACAEEELLETLSLNSLLNLRGTCSQQKTAKEHFTSAPQFVPEANRLRI